MESETLNKRISDQELGVWLAFDQISDIGFGTKKINILYEYFNGLAPAWEASRKELAEIPNLPSTLIDRLIEKRKTIDPEKLRLSIAKDGILAYPICHPDYPRRLKEIHDPPAVLYAMGNITKELFQCPIAIVGTRRPTAYGQGLTKEVTAHLARAGATIISGMAMGIDALAHRAAIEADGKTVAVLASGVDECYPASNRKIYEAMASGKFGAVVSEYPPGITPEPWRFPARNRIISGLSEGVIVIEAGQKSGALITANMCFEQSRELMCFPGRVDSPMSEGTNALIACNKAHLIRDYKDALKELNWAETTAVSEEQAILTAEATMVQLFGREKEVYNLITKAPVHFDYLCEQTGLGAGELSATLTMLELADVIKRSEGDWYNR